MEITPKTELLFKTPSGTMRLNELPEVISYSSIWIMVLFIVSVMIMGWIVSREECNTMPYTHRKEADLYASPYCLDANMPIIARYIYVKVSAENLPLMTRAIINGSTDVIAHEKYHLNEIDQNERIWIIDLGRDTHITDAYFSFDKGAQSITVIMRNGRRKKIWEGRRYRTYENPLFDIAYKR